MSLPTVLIPAMGEHRASVDLVYPDNEIEDDHWIAPPACGQPSPSNRMLCDLPDTDLGHYLGQHLGRDRYGNFRGWKDTRRS